MNVHLLGSVFHAAKIHNISVQCMSAVCVMQHIIGLQLINTRMTEIVLILNLGQGVIGQVVLI